MEEKTEKQKTRDMLFSTALVGMVIMSLPFLYQANYTILTILIGIDSEVSKSLAVFMTSLQGSITLMIFVSKKISKGKI